MIHKKVECAWYYAILVHTKLFMTWHSSIALWVDRTVHLNFDIFKYFSKSRILGFLLFVSKFILLVLFI